MRYLKIFLLQGQHTLEQRSRSVVWFLFSLFNPLIVLVFWQGGTNRHLGGWTMEELTGYYFLLIIASASLMSHIEEDVAVYDIKKGELVNYLLKPISYFWIKFVYELPYRLLQGSFGVVAFFVLLRVFHRFVSLHISVEQILFSFLIAVLAFFISFSLKMIIGLIAFWTVDIYGFYEAIEVLMIVAAGYLMPLSLMPPMIRVVTDFLPFAYIIYYPVAAFTGKFSFIELIKIITVQLMWLVVLGYIFRNLWRQGIRQFTGVGQ